MSPPFEEEKPQKQDKDILGADTRLAVREIMEGLFDKMEETGGKQERGRGRKRGDGAREREKAGIWDGVKGKGREKPQGGEWTVGSCDVKALYPSLKKKECGEIVRRLVE